MVGKEHQANNSGLEDKITTGRGDLHHTQQEQEITHHDIQESSSFAGKDILLTKQKVQHFLQIEEPSLGNYHELLGDKFFSDFIEKIGLSENKSFYDFVNKLIDKEAISQSEATLYRDFYLKNIWKFVLNYKRLLNNVSEEGCKIRGDQKLCDRLDDLELLSNAIDNAVDISIFQGYKQKDGMLVNIRGKQYINFNGTPLLVREEVKENGLKLAIAKDDGVTRVINEKTGMEIIPGGCDDFYKIIGGYLHYKKQDREYLRDPLTNKELIESGFLALEHHFQALDTKSPSYLLCLDENKGYIININNGKIIEIENYEGYITDIMDNGSLYLDKQSQRYFVGRKKMHNHLISLESGESIEIANGRAVNEFYEDIQGNNYIEFVTLGGKNPLKYLIRVTSQWLEDMIPGGYTRLEIDQNFPKLFQEQPDTNEKIQKYYIGKRAFLVNLNGNRFEKGYFGRLKKIGELEKTERKKSEKSDLKKRIDEAKK